MQLPTVSRRRLCLTVSVTGLFIIVSTLSGGIVVGPAGPPADPALGLVVPLSVVFGPAAVAGVTAGVVCTALVRSSLAWLTVVDAGTAGLLGYVSYRLWGVLPGLATGDRPRLDGPAQVVEFLVVTLLAAVTAVSALAWGQVVLQAHRFHGVVVTELPIVLVSTLLLCPVVYPAARALPHHRRQSYDDRTPVSPRSGGFAGAVLVPILWVTLATLFSIAAALVQSIGATTLAQNGYGYVFVPFDPALVGQGGRRVQVLSGALALSVLAATWLDLNQKTQSGRPAIFS